MKKKSIGICIGASTISAVSLKQNPKVKFSEAVVVPHEGNPKKVLSSVLKKLDINDASITVTGRKFKDIVNLSSIPEPEAVEHAYSFISNGKKHDVIISAGGENFIVYALDKKGKVSKVQTGNKCASGTGEFFMQQVDRMGLSVEDASKIAIKGKPHKISGRCSVFCKSDCTHALNKGERKEDVVAGLCEMISRKVLELLVKVPHNKAMFVGGVANNKRIIDFLKKEINDLDIPKEANYFEALGAALHGLKNNTKKLDSKKIFNLQKSAFNFHKPLKEFSKNVSFKTIKRKKAKSGDRCILGLDVGSTTTKAVIIRIKDNAILASSYLRTNGDPVGASRKCYKEIKKHLGKAKINIIGLGTTGSGRHISGLHAFTEGVINEIIAHATASVYFDKDVDTIFEIGGQDAKYTYITNGIASDYAMNEACSAGTGSFLEESAKETLGINFKKIAEIAMKGKNPANFNDQCAAFISSDIKNALHEGISKDDIVAGLVYSICMNYVNRVKGNRPVGKKIFMQGGVCYNKAVPIAMASLTGKKIIVPPEPGLMGAFGVALEVKDRIKKGQIKEKAFDIDKLINRNVQYDKSFKCPGEKDCDRGCEINIIKIDKKKYPFGGACDKFYNARHEKKRKGKNLVALRQRLVFEKYVSYRPKLAKDAKTIGISKSLMTNTLYPLYYNFFTKLGFKVVLGDEVKEEGVEKRGSAFCYPVEIAHGLFQDLVDKKVDYIFLPHILQLPSDGNPDHKKTCVFVQGENYYLKAAFKKDKMPKIISPSLDFGDGFENEIDTFVYAAEKLGVNAEKSRNAYRFAMHAMKKMIQEFKDTGKEALNNLKKEPNRFAVVLFGRVYNAFAKEANLGIPNKFSTRGIDIIPFDFLPLDKEKASKHMYWANGRNIMKSARFVKNHKQLFGTFVTNFSCGPDSFIAGYFRDIMGKKPSLTLELDSHSADVGINTRIEAALDIIKGYNLAGIKEAKEDNDFAAAKIVYGNKLKNTKIVDSSGKESRIDDKKVKVVLPSMGKFGTEAIAAAFRSFDIDAIAMPPADAETLKLGRGNTTCKECLPLILCAGTMIKYLNKRKDKDEVTIFFMPSGSGPCRFGQYHIFLEHIIKKNKMKNVAIMSPTDENTYGGFGKKFEIRGFFATTISDVTEDIRNAIIALAVEKEKSMEIFKTGWNSILHVLEKGSIKEILDELEDFASNLSSIELTKPIEKAKFVSLIGEIFVRKDDSSRLDLVEKLAEKGFVVKTAPIAEYIYYCNYISRKGVRAHQKESKAAAHMKNVIIKTIEKKIKKILIKSKLINYELIDVDQTMKHSKHLIPEYLLGEAILTVGMGMREIINHSCGIISIGPFTCMPSRLAESILNAEMNIEGKIKAAGKDEKVERVAKKVKDLPFLAIETDGNMYPQVIQSRLEVFMLQADRLSEEILD